MNEQRIKSEPALAPVSDSGIGQATAIALDKESADAAVTCFHDRRRRAYGAAGRRAEVRSILRSTIVVEGVLTLMLYQG